MNREEASFILANIDRRVCDDELNEALDMAIKALEQEPILDKITEIIEPLRHLSIDEMSGIEWQILQVFNKYKAQKGEFRALEQEPCEDAISRQAVIDGINEYFHDEYYQRTSIQDCRDCLIEDVIKDMPPVTPQPKTGHWIHFAQSDDCSECRWSTGKYISPSKYCPNCGAKMVDVPDTNIGKMTKIPTGLESEDKE